MCSKSSDSRFLFIFQYPVTVERDSRCLHQLVISTFIPSTSIAWLYGIVFLLLGFGNVLSKTKLMKTFSRGTLVIEIFFWLSASRALSAYVISCCVSRVILSTTKTKRKKERAERRSTTTFIWKFWIVSA